MAIFGFIGFMVLQIHNTLERILRVVAMMTGFLIYFGARALGISIPDLMMASIRNAGPIVFGAINVIVPAATGVLVAWYCVRNIRSDEDIAARVVILLATFVLVIFTDVYAATYRTNIETGSINAALMPNLTFTVGLALYVISNFRHNRVGVNG
jgi:hypothetical protein